MFPSVLPTSRFFLVSVRFFLIIEKRPSSWALECGITRTVFATLKSNYGRGLIARQRLGAFQLFLPLCPHILSSLLYAFRACAKSVRNPRLRVIAWPAIPMRENHAKCVTLEKSDVTSRASAAALSTVLRKTTLSYGNMRFSGITQQKPLNRSRWNFARLITLASLRDVPKMAVIGWLGAAPQIGEV